jgi:RNA polymerase sigma-70 factor (ECF subfamily)
MSLPGNLDVRPLAAADEAALLAALRTGDDAAFEQLVRLHGPRMLSVIKRFLPQESDAADALQDAFLSAYRALPTFQGEAQLGTWLHRIAVNAALMKLRSRRRRPERSIDELLPKFLEDGHRIAGGSWSPRADRALEDRETREAVRRAIHELPDDFRTVLLLRDIEGYSTLETAKILALSESAVKTRLHRARLALREQLDAQFREAGV